MYKAVFISKYQVTIELIRYVKGAELKDSHNCFLNLGLASVMFSQPGRPPKTEIKPGLSYTPWDLWQVQGDPSFSLQDFVKYFRVSIYKARYFNLFQIDKCKNYSKAFYLNYAFS